MNPLQRHLIGMTSLAVTALGLGGGALGNLYAAMSDENALATIDAAYRGGVRYFDTAPLYGYGLSERRVGMAVSRYPRHEVVISTKVGRVLAPRATRDPNDAFVDAPAFDAVFDYSRDAALRSLEESLKRLQTDRVDIVFIHDPDESVTQRGADPYAKSHFNEVMAGAYPALAELRAQGAIKAIGAGMNQWQMLSDFARAGDFDCFLLAGRYTLLEQTAAHTFLPLCAEKHISVIIGGPFNSGILATGVTANTHYEYRTPPPQIVERVRQIEAVCARHGVSLPAAALQFPFGHPAVAAVIPGAASPNEVRANSAYCQQPIPTDFWAELRHLKLLDEAAPVPV
jgi:D-threo-aldose 1-dehydrogenase